MPVIDRIGNAYADVWMGADRFDEAESMRQLKFKEAFPLDVGEFDYVMRFNRIGRYNHYDSDRVVRTLRKHCPKVMVNVAREHSVALYFSGDGAEKILRLKEELHASEVSMPEKGIVRVFWD